MKPLNSFEGLGIKENASFVLETINAYRPRLVIVEYPKTYWTKLNGADPTTNGGKQKLKKLREHHRPFLALTQQIAEHQNRSGDDFLLELPLRAQPQTRTTCCTA